MRSIARRTATLAMFCAAAAILAFPAAAQQNRDDTETRSVQGTVTDASGGAVSDAVVQLKDTKTLQIRSYRTQADGTYHFAGLSPNVEYELRAEFNGASSGKKTLSVFNTQKVATINLKLNK